MKKKLLSMIMALVMIATLIPAFNAQSIFAADAVDEFKDTTAETVNTTAYNSIYWAVGEGIIKGFDDGTFRPTASCTREQFVVMIWRLAEKPAAEAKVSFSDIESSRSTYKAIRWAVAQGIIKGFDDGTFRPGDTVTRQQIAIMLWRMAGKPAASGSTSFKDITGSSSGYEAIQWGAAAGLIKGFSDGSFGPAQDCQRQQIAIFLTRYAKNILKKDTTAPEVKKAGESAAPDTPSDTMQEYYFLTKETLNGKPVYVADYNENGGIIKATQYTITYSGHDEANVSENPANISEYEYDADGFRTKQIFKKNSFEGVAAFSYDTDGNVIKVVLTNDGTDNGYIECGYDGNGNLVKYIEYTSNGEVKRNHTFDYNTAGQLVKHSYRGSDYSADYITENVFYDSNGNPIKTVRNRDGEETVLREKEYDPKGNLIKITQNGEPLDSYEYDSAGNMVKNLIYRNGKVTVWTEYEYDSDGNQTKASSYAGDGTDGSLTGYTEYSYDAHGNKIKEIRYDPKGKVKEEHLYEYKTLMLDSTKLKDYPGYTWLGVDTGLDSFIRLELSIIY